MGIRTSGASDQDLGRGREIGWPEGTSPRRAAFEGVAEREVEADPGPEVEAWDVADEGGCEEGAEGGGGAAAAVSNGVKLHNHVLFGVEAAFSFSSAE